MRGLFFLACLCLGGAPAARAAEYAITLEVVRAGFVAALGGEERLGALEAVAYRGAIQDEDGNVVRVDVLKRRPDRVRTVLTRPDGLRLAQGYDGTTAWRAIEFAGQVQIEALRGDAAAELVRGAPFDHPLFRPEARQAELKYQGIVLLGDERPFHCVVASFPDGAQSTHYLDVESFHERKTLSAYATAEGARFSESVMADFRQVEGLWFPFQSVEQSDDGKRFEVVIEALRVNPPAPEALFTMPEAE